MKAKKQMKIFQNFKPLFVILGLTALFLSLVVVIVFTQLRFEESKQQLERRNAKAASADLFTPYPYDLTSFYEAYSGFGGLPLGSPNAGTFAAYAITPVNNQLYLGLSMRPACCDGAMIARFSDGDAEMKIVPISNTPNNVVTEQGIQELVYDPTTSLLYSPGVDPSVGDDWELGNAYTIDSTEGVGTKYRENTNLESVVHGFGATVDPNGMYYYGTGSFVTVPYSTEKVSIGEVFKSEDKGKTWDRISIDPPAITSPDLVLFKDRVYGLAWLGDRLYAAANEAPGNAVSFVFYTADDGRTWEKFEQVYSNGYLTNITQTTVGEAKDFILTASQNNMVIYKINPSGSVDTFSTPFTLQKSPHMFASDGSWIYTIADDVVAKQSSIYRSQDLSNWQLVDTFPQYNDIDGGRVMTLAYWPVHNELVLSTSGPTAQLFHLNPKLIPEPTALISVTPVPTRPPTQCLPCSDPRYDHNGDGIINTADSQWFISNCMGQPSSPSCPDLNNSGGVFNSADISCTINCFSPSPSPTTVPTPTVAPISITIANPNGGEVLVLGSTHRISWTSSSVIDKVSIGYKTCDSCLEWITNNIPNTGYYDWKISSITPSLPHRIYIIGYQTGVGSTTDVSDGTFSLTELNAPSPTAVNNLSIHVGDLDARKLLTNRGSIWNALITISVHSNVHLPVSGVKVTGSWIGTTGPTSCITNTNGMCDISSTFITGDSVMFTVTSLKRESYTYSGASNHDPENDSNGTAIVVTK